MPSLSAYLALALILRVTLIAYGIWMDSWAHLPYTDVDYHVFTDGAELISRGRSPFELPTYRYTPLLALLLVPNVWVHRAWGKLLFCAADLGVGALLYAFLARRRVPAHVARRCACAWLFNPLAVNVSTRGNAESLTALLLLLSLHALAGGRPAGAGGLLAAATHFKLYPVIYAPAFVACLEPTLLAVTRARLAFVGGLVAAWTALAALAYGWCGEAYVRETLLYHVSRADVRHNFSPYFYALYLAGDGGDCGGGDAGAGDAGAAADDDCGGGGVRRLLSLVAFAPQAVLLLAAAARLGRDLPFCMFVQTLVFVAFNKVSTAQYFVWYHVLLPLVLPSSAALQSQQLGATARWVGAWLGSLGLWLFCAYLLEYRGVAAFVAVWLASLAFFAANVGLVRLLVRAHAPSPLFREGRLARQCIVATVFTATER